MKIMNSVSSAAATICNSYASHRWRGGGTDLGGSMKALSKTLSFCCGLILQVARTTAVCELCHSHVDLTKAVCCAGGDAVTANGRWRRNWAWDAVPVHCRSFVLTIFFCLLALPLRVFSSSISGTVTGGCRVGLTVLATTGLLYAFSSCSSSCSSHPLARVMPVDILPSLFPCPTWRSYLLLPLPIWLRTGHAWCTSFSFCLGTDRRAPVPSPFETLPISAPSCLGKL